MPLPFGEGVDKKKSLGYSIDAKGLPADGSPQFRLRDNRDFGEGGYLFLLSWRTKAMTVAMTMQN